jgi:hypothetical protein
MAGRIADLASDARNATWIGARLSAIIVGGPTLLHWGDWNMGHEIEDRIRLRAYELWEREGRPAGNDLQFWLIAEAEVLEEPVKAVRALAAEVAATLPRLAPRKRKPKAA